MCEKVENQDVKNILPNKEDVVELYGQLDEKNKNVAINVATALLEAQLQALSSLPDSQV